MRKFLIVTLFVGLLVLLMASAAFATAGGSATKHVKLTASSGQFYPDCCGTILFEEYRLTVGDSGSYTFNFANNTMPALDSNTPLALVYNECGFDPGNFGAGMLGLLGEGASISLKAGTYSVAFISNQGSSANGGNLVTGSYDATVSGPGSVSFGGSCFSSGPGAPMDPGSDPDGDGIPTGEDNCAMAFNPDQENGWGSAMGDACDIDWYNMSGIGLSGYEQLDGMYHLHGNCRFLADGDPRCPEIARFNPAEFDPAVMPMTVNTDKAGSWSVVIHYLHSNNGPAVYQVNVYSTNPPQPDTLIDDRLEFHVNADGTWQWYQRGGSSDYNGI